MNMSFLRTATRVAAVVAAGLLMVQQAVAAASELKGLSSKTTMPAFKSSNPKYAKVPMTEDGSKTVAVAFDESRGTGRGYDTMYVIECDDQGNVLKYEQCPGSRKTEGDTAIYSFKPVNRNVAFKKDLPPGKAPFSVVFEYARTETKIPKVKGSKKLGTQDTPAREEIKEEFVFSAVISVLQEKSEWSYMLSGRLPVTESIGGNAVNFADGSMQMKVNSSRPDPKKQEVGFGVDFLLGEYTLACTKDGRGVPVAIEIKDDKGKSIEKIKKSMDELEYEVKTKTRRVSNCAPGGG